MKIKNVQALENLSLFSHVSGVMTVVLGLIVILIDLSNSDYDHIQVGIFVLVTGYAFVKISAKLTNILRSEADYGANQNFN